MRTAVISFLWLGLLLQPDSVAAGEVSTDSNPQCLVGAIVNQALQLQSLSSQVLQQGSQLQEQASQLQKQESQLQKQESQLQEQASRLQKQASQLQKQESQLQKQESQLQEQASQLQQQSSELQQLRSLQNKVTSMESDLEWQSASLLELNNSRSKQVVFSAHFSINKIINVGTGGTLKYNYVVTNIGGGYSSLTGRFTAPHTGIYAFFTSLRSSNNHPWIRLAIFKGGQSLMIVTADGKTNAWNRGTALVTTHMNKGEIAYVRHVESSTFLEAAGYTTFSGMLVAAD